MNIKRLSNYKVVKLSVREVNYMENAVRRLDFSKLNFSDKVISTKEALKDVSPFNFDKDKKIIVTGINKK